MVDDDPPLALPAEIVIPEALSYAAVDLIAAERFCLLRAHDAGHIRLDIAALVYLVPLRTGNEVSVYGKSDHGNAQHSRQRAERIRQVRGAAVKRITRLRAEHKNRAELVNAVLYVAYQVYIMYELTLGKHAEPFHQRQRVRIEALKCHNIVDGLRVRCAQHDVEIHH